MKIVKAASGKRTLKMSKNEWVNLGKTAGWLDEDDHSEVDEETFKMIDDVSKDIKVKDEDVDLGGAKDPADVAADKDEAKAKEDRAKAKHKQDKEHAGRKKQVYDKDPIA